MALTREERRAHLKLDEPCILIGGHSSTVFKGLLAHHLRTTIPEGKSAFLCHACNIPKCSNPAHLYWGTPKDNYLDMVEAGTAAFKAVPQEEQQRIFDAIAVEPRTRGFTARLTKQLGVSNRKVRHYVKLFDSL
jgi:hypothetical protein